MPRANPKPNLNGTAGGGEGRLAFGGGGEGASGSYGLRGGSVTGVVVRPSINKGALYNDDEDDGKCFRQMFDKNTLRTAKGAQIFKNVIERLRSSPKEELLPPDTLQPWKGSKNGVTVFARKRPLFAKEKETHDFDTVTVHPHYIDVGMLAECGVVLNIKSVFRNFLRRTAKARKISKNDAGV